VSGHRLFDVAVLGTGPAGLTAALALAREQHVVVATARLPDGEVPGRVDCVPIRLLSTLQELGIETAVIRAHRPAGPRRIAWSSATPDRVYGHATVHLERPRLELALLTEVLRNGRIEIVIADRRPQFIGGLFVGDAWRAPRVIDATGAAGVMAPRRVRPAKPWASRTWMLPRPPDKCQQFDLATLPQGYVFRLATPTWLTIGVVGEPAFVRSDVTTLDARLRTAGHAWMLDDVPALDRLMQGWQGRGSVQWSELAGIPVLPIGDAALARDPLSSQGLATAIGDALAVAAVNDEASADLFRERYRIGVVTHLRALATHVRTVRWATSPAWHAYAAFLAANEGTEPTTDVALVNGRLSRVTREPPPGSV